ncbi:MULTISPECIES: serine hydrolase [Nostoc]|uniref:Beta-lactamase family protein n=1 Tax=Nostoc paludosum FACHB-159 TaxID=2692908 RepID=A0ABR8KIK8_9NOSO|nr:MULTISPECIES: serine hydrolase domain-containing protein [Nostoc]MBD2682267.1 beta-lactamase family protein [Nostoc sp. FACHB-857]MBD2738601.1 beta-lactamase family protein [Nostoc paludosum FACHB-159]
MTLPSPNKVDELFSEWDKPGSPGFALAIIKDGKTVYKRGYGIADLEHNVTISPNSVFDIASTSKQFTAMCIALLARKGELSLDDEIQIYISEIPRYEYPITVRHLIHHTSGIRDYLTLMGLAGMRCENEYPENEIIGLIARQKELNFKPGEEHLYSNSGYFLLAEIVKRVSGESLAVFSDKHIFSPLGMKTTHFHDDFTRIVRNRAIGYSVRDESSFRIDMSIFDVVGDGGIYTTVEDLCIWDENFYQNKLGGYGQDLIEEIITPGRLNSGEGIDYAFGLVIGHYRGLETISHSGGWMGYSSQMLRFPKQRFSVICLSNLGSAEPPELARKVADIYLVDDFTEQSIESVSRQTQIREIPSVDLESKTGFYQNPKTGTVWELLVKDGKLSVEFAGMSFTLAPVSSNHFVIMDIPYNADVEFEEAGLDEPSHLYVCWEGKTRDVFQRLDFAPPDSEQLMDFTGEYYCKELDVTYRISIEDGELLLNRRNSLRETLKPINKDLLEGTDITLQFVRDDFHQVAGFNMSAGYGSVRNIQFVK